MKNINRASKTQGNQGGNLSIGFIISTLFVFVILKTALILINAIIQAGPNYNESKDRLPFYLGGVIFFVGGLLLFRKEKKRKYFMMTIGLIELILGFVL